MKCRMLRLGLSLMLGIGTWTNRLPAQSAPAAPAPSVAVVAGNG
jgi:hypothetical protein